MTKFFLSFFLCISFISNLFAQTTADSGIIKSDTQSQQKKIAVKDTVIKPAIHTGDLQDFKKDSINTSKADTLDRNNKTLNLPHSISLFKDALLQNPYFSFFGKIYSQDIQVHKANSEDGLFYFILGLCFYFALIRLFFYKYVSNLMSLFFRASMRQQQMREQAQQTPLPSLLLNILFVFVSGLYACFVVQYYQFAPQTAFWLLFIYCVLIIGAIYFARFCILKLSGWVFNITKTTDNYTFIVFLVNKIAGIALLPFLIVIAFSDSLNVEVAITISFIMIGILFVYRFAVGYATVRSEIKLSLFHYFIYLCAFEIAPLLLIYKVALTYLKKAY